MTDARTKRRLNTVMGKAGIIPPSVPPCPDTVSIDFKLARDEYIDRLKKIYEEHKPEKLDNVESIISKSKGYHKTYTKICKKYKIEPEDSYGGVSKKVMEGTIMDLMEKLKQANQSSHEFNFLLGQSLGAGEKLVDAKESLQRNVDELQNQIISKMEKFYEVKKG